MKNWKKVIAAAFAAVLTVSALPATAQLAFAEPEAEEVVAASDVSEDGAEEVNTTEENLTTTNPLREFKAPKIVPESGKQFTDDAKEYRDINENGDETYSVVYTWAPNLPASGYFQCGVDYTCVATITVNKGFTVKSPEDQGWTAEQPILSKYLGSGTYVFKRAYPRTMTHNLVKVEGRKPSGNDYGSSTYWQCTAEGCGKVFADDAGTVETTMDAINGVDTMYRLYNRTSGEHLYTADKVEKEALKTLGWADEGVGWIAPKISSTPVYRVYNPNTGDHHYTTDKTEKDYLVSIGWNDEGIGWYSDDFQTVPLLREFNPNAQIGTHNYTKDQREHNYLVSIGWNPEGYAWYARG